MKVTTFVNILSARVDGKYERMADRLAGSGFQFYFEVSLEYYNLIQASNIGWGDQPMQRGRNESSSLLYA